MSIEVRPATEADVEAIRAIGAATWPSTYAFAGEAYVTHGVATWWSAEATVRTVRETRTLVALADDQVVGVGNLDLRRDPPVIWKLYVVPSAHGTGVGAALIVALLQVARGEGASAVLLEYVDGNDRAAAFYRRQGFSELRREPSDRVGWPDIVWVRRSLADDR